MADVDIAALREYVGRESPPIRYAIDAGSIRFFSASLLDADAATQEPAAAPPTFFGSAIGLGGVAAGDPRTMFGLSLPLPPGWPTVATGDEFDFYRVVETGMVLICHERFIDVREKQGRSGRLIFYTSEKRFTTEDGAPVLRRLLRCAAREPGRGRAPAMPPAEDPLSQRRDGAPLPELTVGPVAVRYLAMFATATAEYVDFHYDADYARNVGLPGPIIQGLYKTALIASMLARWSGDASLVHHLNVQHRGMDLAGSMLTAGGAIRSPAATLSRTDVECDVWVRNQDGIITTRGTGRVARRT